MVTRLDGEATVALEWAYRQGSEVTVEVMRDLVPSVAEAAVAGLRRTPNFVRARILTGSDIPPVPQAVLTAWPEQAYSPGQKRDSVGRFGSGGGGSVAPSAPASTGRMTAKEAHEALDKIGMRGSDLGSLDDGLRGEVVASFQKAHAQHPALFRAMDVAVTTQDLQPHAIAETRSSTYNGVPDVEGYRRGDALVVLNAGVFKSTAIAHQTMADAGRTGWLAGNTVDHAIQHEVGHVFDAALNRPSDPMTIHREPSEFAVAASTSMAPSMYARQDNGERFAELFALTSTKGGFGTRDGEIVKRLYEENP